MRTATLVAVAGLCAGALVAAQAPAPAPSLDVKVIAQVGSQVAGIMGAFQAMDNAAGENEFVMTTSRGPRLAISWRRGSDAATARPVKTEIVDFSARTTNIVNYFARSVEPLSFADLTKRAADWHSNSINLKKGEDIFPQTSGIDMPVQSRARAKRFDYIAETRETGQARPIAGVNARQVLMSVRAWDHTKTFEDNGGWVVTTEAWIGPRTPAIDRIVATQRDYARTINKGVYDAVFTSVELPDAERLDPMFPELMPVAAHVVAEIDKLEGTVLASRTTYEVVRSAKEMLAAVRAYQAMERAAGKPATADPSAMISKRERIAALGFEYLSIDYAVTNLDVEIPDGFMRKKK